MTRIFLKLYLLLLLPLLVMMLLPQSPLSMLSQWWTEKETHRQFSAIYPLVMEELAPLPESQWQQKVKELSQHFAFLLALEKQQDTKLKPREITKLSNQGYALVTYKKNYTLAFSIKESDYILLASLGSHVSTIDEYEKDTRGFRYFLNKKISQVDKPFEEFNRIKGFFNFDLKLSKMNDFVAQNKDKKEMIATMLDKHLYIESFGSKNFSYILSDDNQYIVSIKATNSRRNFRRYFRYLSFIVPALLLALGVLIWLFLFRKEFKVLNKAAKTFGSGQLDTRIHLSKNSTLYPIAGSFNTMASRIQALLEGHKDLTNAVSHELKTPLSRLHFALEMQKNSQTEEEREIYTQKIESNVEALEQLVDELLSYTRMQRQQGAEFSAQPLKAWLENEIQTFTEYHPNIAIETTIKTAKAVIFDQHLMSRALDNLLSNAAKYAKPNSPKIKISAHQNAEFISLNVEDNGEGIAKDDCKKIFEPFTRLDKSRQRNHQSLGGYGMGLAIVQRIMEQHKGQTNCEKSSLGGVKISLQWPLSP